MKIFSRVGIWRVADLESWMNKIAHVDFILAKSIFKSFQHTSFAASSLLRIYFHILLILRLYLSSDYIVTQMIFTNREAKLFSIAKFKVSLNHIRISSFRFINTFFLNSTKGKISCCFISSDKIVTMLMKIMTTMMISTEKRASGKIKLKSFLIFI